MAISSGFRSTSRATWRLIALVSAWLLASSSGTAAQTLTVNKEQTTLSGQQLDSTNVSVGMPIVYVITISSSAGTNPSVTLTDILPAGFILINVDCTAQNAAKCPNGGPSQSNIPFSGNPVVLSGFHVPAGGSSSVEIRMTGYFVKPGPLFTNRVEARRAGETVLETTAWDETTLTIPNNPLPVDLELTKTVTPTTGSTGTTGSAGTSYHFKITIKNNSASAVYLGGFSLTDLLKLQGGNSVGYKLANFTCSNPACPTLSTSQTFTGSVNSTSPPPAFQLTWSPLSMLQGSSAFVLEFDATFDRNVACGTESSTIRNEAFLTLANSATSLSDALATNNTGAATLTSSFSLPACTGGGAVDIKKTQISPSNPVPWGQDVTYQIDFKNTSSATLTNFSITDNVYPPLPVKATITSIPSCSPACLPTAFDTTFPAVAQLTGYQKLFKVTFPSIAIGQTVSITFKVKYETPCDTASGPGTIPITNYAFPSIGSNAYVTTQMVALPDCGLGVTKSLNTTNPVLIGQPVEFKITYTNPFPQSVTVLTLKDVLSLTSAKYGDLPIQLVASSCQASPAGSVLPLPVPAATGSKTVKYNNPPWSGLLLLDAAPVTFAQGATLTCTIRFVPQQPTGCQGTADPTKPQLINTAIIDTSVINPNQSQKPPVSAFATADLPLCRDIAVTKSAPVPQSFTPGQTVSYKVRVTNNNPSDPVLGINVNDPLPTGFTYVSSSCTACSPPPQLIGTQVQATIPVIPANGFVVITIVVTAPSTGGSYNNVATASFAQQGSFFQGPGTVLMSTANVQVLTPRLTKAFSPGKEPSQSTLTFTITNVPDNPKEKGITFTDTLPAGFQIVGQPSTTCKVGSATVAGNAITFTGELQAGEASCTVVVQVTGSGCNDRSNVSNTSNIDPSGVNAMVNVKECPLALTVNKTVSGAPSGFSGPFSFNVTCSTPGGLLQKKLSLVWPSTTVSLAGIPAGSICTVSEDPALPPAPTGYSWVGVPISDPAGGVVNITKDGKNQVSFRNEMRACDDRGQVKITKRVEGAPAGFTGTFNFNLSCWSGTTLITKQAQILVPGASSVTVGGIPSGSLCTVTEAAPLPSLPAGWFWLAPSYLPASGSADIVGNCCPEVVVIDRAKFCCTGNSGAGYGDPNIP